MGAPRFHEIVGVLRTSTPLTPLCTATASAYGFFPEKMIHPMKIGVKYIDNQTRQDNYKVEILLMITRIIASIFTSFDHVLRNNFVFKRSFRRFLFLQKKAV